MNHKQRLFAVRFSDGKTVGSLSIAVCGVDGKIIWDVTRLENGIED